MTITLTNTEFKMLVTQSRRGAVIDCQDRWYELTCPACLRTVRVHETWEIFVCTFCEFQDPWFQWKPDNMLKDGPSLRPIGWKYSRILEN